MRQTEPTPCPLQPQHERNYSFLQKGYYSLLVQKPTLVITSLRISCKACTVNVLKKIRLDVFGHFCLNCRVSKNQCRIACSHETYAPINQNKKKSKETVGNVFPCVFFSLHVYGNRTHPWTSSSAGAGWAAAAAAAA
jgi:hypothetical protein